MSLSVIRSAKLPEPAVIGNAGVSSKNPTVTSEQCADIIACDEAPLGNLSQLADLRLRLEGQDRGHAGVYAKQALVLVNRGTAAHL